MGTQSNNPNKYWRTGVAIPVARKAQFEERMTAMGLATMGDLASFFGQAEGVLEALTPLVPAWRAKRTEQAEVAKMPAIRRELMAKMKTLGPEELQRLVAAVSAKEAEVGNN